MRKKANKDKLIMLPGGSWIRPGSVSEIMVEDAASGILANPPRALVYAGEQQRCHVVKFDRMDQARKWAAELAAIVNK